MMQLKSLVLATTLSFTAASHADDTEIFLGTQTNTNLMFVLDASGSMRSKDGTSVRRFERMKNAMHLLIDQLDGVNIGLIRYYQRSPDTPVQLVAPMQPVRGNRAALKSAVTSIALGDFTTGGTPSVAALYEAKKYFQGDAPYRGTTPDDQPRYASPVTHQCDSNHIIFLTDGLPTPDAQVANHLKTSLLGSCVRESGNKGNCGVELARHLATVDQFPDLPGINTINTHSIGFNISTPWVTNVAGAGGGLYREAGSTGELLLAFTSIIDNIGTGDHSFSPPAITIDPHNPLSNRNDVYLTLFQPANRPSWHGNLKRYSLTGEPLVLRDATNAIATDPATGALSASARSYWSTVVDGNNVRAGGAAGQISASGRKVVSNLAGHPDLSLSGNLVTESNTGISRDMLDVATDSIRESVLKWARGVDVLDSDNDGQTTDARTEIGDPLHSSPVIVNYGRSTQNEPDSVVYFGTNDGYLHAIDAANGNERFAYVPRELLPRLAQAHANSGAGDDKLYGVDGEIGVWWHDDNRDRRIASNDGDHVYLYTGLRRGGRHYYALDVTDTARPKHLWTILGGSGEFSEMGQSWAKPIKGNIRLNGALVPVLVISGGYDPAQDNHSVRSPDTMGRAVYIVNARTGALIWKAGREITDDVQIDSMQYSIPASPTVLDLNGDGLIDQIYVGDMGGQILRFDLNPKASTAAELATGGVIATLAGEEASDNRRFYNSPDIALVNPGHAPMLVVSIGSGFRAHPLDTGTQDRFYMVRQPLVHAQSGYGIRTSTDWRPIAEADLYDASDNDIQQGNAAARAAASAALSDANGWMIRLSAGEKVLAKSLTVNNQVIFTTYVPGTAADACGAQLGSSRAYALNLFDATPAFDGANRTAESRYITLQRPGIAPAPVPFFGADPHLLAGVEVLPDVDFGNLLRRVSWSDQSER